MWRGSRLVVSHLGSWRVATLDAKPTCLLPYRLLFFCLAAVLIASLQPFPLHASPFTQTSDPAEATTVYVLSFSGPVTPILDSYLRQAIAEAEESGAGVIILQLDTPGGSVEVTKAIIQRMLASPIPLVVYVAPAGARAGSAGTFITLAGHVAAMTPNSSIGAASPVELGGADIDETLAAKITNILSADIENLARRRGEAATEWAIDAVQEAAAATSSQALELGVIDLIATDLDDLLRQLDGRTVELASGAQILHTANAHMLLRDMTPIQRALNILVDPNLTAILLSIGILGLVVEVRTPGINVAGILGIVCLLLAFYGLGQLDANLTGLIFMVIALAFFVAEAFTPASGILTAGGITAFLFGGALLFDTPGIATPWGTLILFAILLGAFAILVSRLALRAHNRPVVTGSEGLIGASGVAKTPFRVGETGSVFVQGEWWNARLTSGEVSANETVRVVGRQGLTLSVVPLTLDPALEPSADSSVASAPQATHPVP